MHLRLRTTTAIAGIALAASLTACTGGASTGSPTPSSSTQTVAEACAAVRSGVADAAARLRDVDLDDPEAAIGALTDIASRLGDAAATVDNPDVGAALPGLQSAFSRAAEILRAISGGDLMQLPALQSATGDIQSAFTEFGRLCAGD